MALSISTATITSATGSNTPQSTAYTIPSNTKWIVTATDIDNSNTSANNTECDVKTLNGVNMGSAVARIASDAGGTGQLKNAYAVQNPASGDSTLVTNHLTTVHFKEIFSIVSENAVSMNVSPVVYGTGASASITVDTQIGDLVIYSVTLNNNNPTAITASSTPPNNNQTLVQSGGTDASQGSRIYSKVAAGSSTSAAWSFSASQRYSVVAFVFHENTASITSITDPVIIGENVSLSTSGFSDGAATFDLLGFDVSTTISSNDASFNFVFWGDGETFPLLPATNQTATISQGATSAIANVDVDAPPEYVKVTFSAAITDNPKFFGYHLEGQANTVNGSAFWYIPVNDLVVNPDTGLTTTSSGTTTGWFRDSVTGIMSSWILVFNDAGEVVSAEGLSVRGLAVTGLTMTGLSVRGL